MASLADLLTSGALAVGQNIFQQNAPPALQSIVGTGADIYNQRQLLEAEQDRISQMNQGFNQATGLISGYGDRALDAVTQGALGAQGAITSGATQARQDVLGGLDQARLALTGGSDVARQDILGGAEQARQSITDATARGVGAQQPFYDAGVQTLNEFLGILSDPSSVMDIPGVQFQYEQGLEALNRQLEGNNLLNSGRRLLAAQEYGQGLASTALDQALNRRLPIVQGGLTSAGRIGTLEGTAGTNLANIATQSGRSLADIASMTGRNLADLETGAGTNLANIATGAGTNLANIQSQMGTNIANIQTDIGGNLADLALDQNALLSNRDLADAVASSGMTDILFGGAGGQALQGQPTLGQMFGDQGFADGGVLRDFISGNASIGDLANSAGNLFGDPGTGFSLLGTGLNPMGEQARMLAEQNVGLGATDATAQALGANPLVNNLAVGGLAGGALGAAIAGLTGGDIAGGAATGVGAGAGAAIGSAVMPGIGTAIGGFLGGTIGGEIGKALGFSGKGGGEDKPDYSISLSPSGSRYDTGISAEGPWGVVGLGHQKHIKNTDAFKKASEAIVRSDQIMSALFTPEQNQAIKREMEQSGVIAQNSNEGGFSPQRMMNTVFQHRADAIRRAVGDQVYSSLNIGPMYQALASGDQGMINQAFSSLAVV